MSQELRHTLGVIDEAFSRLRAEILIMAAQTRTNLINAINGLFERDTALCNQAIADDSDVDLLEKKIDREGTEIIVRYTPFATDLRRVLGAMKVAAELERISDQAVGIARRGRKLNESPALDDVFLVRSLTDAILAIYDEAVLVFEEENVERALQIKPMDKKIDVLHRELIEEMNRGMEKHPDRLKDYLEVVFLIRFLERAADHAVNIGENAIYIRSGQDIRYTQS